MACAAMIVPRKKLTSRGTQHEIKMNKSTLVNLVSINGRFNRRKFLNVFLGAFLAAMAFIIPAAIVASLAEERNPMLSNLMVGIIILIELLSGLVQIPQMIKRLHDMNRSGWWWLTCLIPMAGIIPLIILFFVKGTSGTNDYGPDPLRPENSPQPVAA
jgi:uncharacterized membrane protein YhaH (DUF805 family)